MGLGGTAVWAAEREGSLGHSWGECELEERRQLWLRGEVAHSSQFLGPLFAQFPEAGVMRAGWRKARPREVSDWLRVTP